ncbi:MAG: signal peptidase I [bacterium]
MTNRARLRISADPDKAYIHIGASMSPTLRGPDVVQVVPYNDKEVECGDIIVFRPVGRSYNVTHRVVRVEGEKIYTRGDNNCDADGWVVSPDQIKGRVVSAQRGDRRLPIYGGRLGKIVEGVFRFNRKFRSLLGPLYRALAGRIFIPLKTSTLVFQRQSGVEYQLLLGKKVIGRWNSRSKRWNIRAPFRFVIDEAALPRAD